MESKQKKESSELASGSPQGARSSPKMNENLSKSGVVTSHNNNSSQKKHKAKQSTLNSSSSDSFDTPKKSRKLNYQNSSSDSSSMQIANSDISDVSITSSDSYEESSEGRREKKPLQVSKLISADMSKDIIAPPDQQEDDGFIHGDPFGQKFTDTDAEPSISNPDQARQELLAELPQKASNAIEAEKKSFSCALL